MDDVPVASVGKTRHLDSSHGLVGRLIAASVILLLVLGVAFARDSPVRRRDERSGAHKLQPIVDGTAATCQW
jgi:hypothetical protein